jgi:hypothetical protein
MFFQKIAEWKIPISSAFCFAAESRMKKPSREKPDGKAVSIVR